jgi:hypothetical protein
MDGNLHLEWDDANWKPCSAVRSGPHWDNTMNTGQLVMTKGITEKIAEDILFARFVTDSLKRYLRQDWGDIAEEDKLLNAKALAEGTRILAAYKNDLDKI